MAASVEAPGELISQSDNRRRNDELAAELEKLSGIKTTANATKQSKSAQVVSSRNPMTPSLTSD